MNLTKFTRAKCKILHLGWGSPQYQYRLGMNGSRAAWRRGDFRVLVGEQLDVTHLHLQPIKPTICWATSEV